VLLTRCCAGDKIERMSGVGQVVFIVFCGGTDGKRQLVRARRRWEVTSNVSQITGLLEHVSYQ